MADSFKGFNRRRSHQLGQLTIKINEFNLAILQEDQLAVGDYEYFHEGLEKIEAKHNEAMDRMLNYAEATEDLMQEHQKKFDDGFNPIFRKVKLGLKGNHQQPMNGAYTAKVKLPAIELPKFDGAADAWISFRDSFKGLVHTNRDLTKAMKFRYLKTSITDKLSPVAHLMESDDGYDEAWEAVIGFYDDVRKIVDKHIYGILSSKKMAVESHDELQRLVNEFSNHTSALEREMTKEELYDVFIANFAIHRLDSNTRNLFETDNDEKFPKWPAVKIFLERRRKVLSTLPVNRSPKGQEGSRSNNSNSPLIKQQHQHKHANVANSSPAQDLSFPVQALNSPVQALKKKCLCCQGVDHRMYGCSQFKSLNYPQRVAKVKELKVCANCFGYHPIAQCKSTYTCSICNLKHHTLLHSPPMESKEKNAMLTYLDELQSRDAAHFQSSSSEATAFQSRASMNANTSKDADDDEIVFSSTALVNIKDEHGHWHEVRALIDGGATANYMTERVAKLLKLKTQPTRIEANGFGETKTVISLKTRAMVTSYVDPFLEQMTFLITKKITGYIPNEEFNATSLHIPDDLPLADPTFGKPGRIDIIIGNEWCLSLQLPERVQLPAGPILQNTVFGYIIGGKVKPSSKAQQRFCNLVSHTHADLKESLERFYKDEDYRNETRFLTAEESYCETHFEQTHQRDSEGRFIVEMPLKDNIDQLSNNRGQAMCQFIANEKRLVKNEHLYTETKKFMHEYEQLGHMTEVFLKPEENGQSYYLPHHAVEKPDSTTTKVRVVFNASSKTKSGLSLNDCQYNGPNVQSDGFSLILKFRIHQVVIKADIAKMYRQIALKEEQRHLQLILWRESPIEPIRTFQLNTVTYGTKSGSFLATRCVKQLGIEHRKIFPAAAAEVENSFYVDDLMSGGYSTLEATNLFKQIDHIISSGAMKLRKISSNCEEFMKSIPEEDRESIASSSDPTLKALGIKWNPKTDRLMFDIHPIESTKVTRSHALSEIMKIYDPEGLLGPVVFKFKMFMKTITEMKCGWNEQLPEKEAEDWKEIASTFIDLRNVEIPRQFLISKFIVFQVHGFSDASEKGYGAAIYIRSEDEFGNRMCQLVCAKSRIAPSARKSIARLELCGAVILTHLMEKTVKALNMQAQRKVSWTDSAIVLHWLKKDPSQLQPYVANRVSEIQEMATNTAWKHIPGEQNPADLISRGLLPEELINNRMWWHGPEFLMEPEDRWPHPIVSIDAEDPAYKSEFKRILISHTNVIAEPNPFIQLSEDSSRSFTCKWKLAFITRFVYNIRANLQGKAKRTGKISVADLQDAEDTIARIHQMKFFSDEFKALSNGKPIPANSRLLNLDPQWDPTRKLIRVGGRLCHARTIDDNQKHPVILPPNCQLTKQLVRETHERAMHAGQQATHGILKMKYWPLRANEIVRRECHKCIRCFRARPKMIQQFMGQLPAARVSPAPVFYNTGVDFAGPISMKSGYLRNARPMKTYIAVFVCLSTKAIHLEIVSDLTTKAFIAALDRFTSRRGLAAHMYSDHGTNFVGAKNEINDLYNFFKSSSNRAKIDEHFLKQEVTWHFIPPRAPNQGGLWEAAVKSMKHHLLRVTQNALMHYEDLSTVVCKIEAILNSRPIIPLSDDPKDLAMLTNGHILIGRPLIALPQPNLIDHPTSRLQRWDRVQEAQQNFWNRWSKEYLHQLQARTKDYRKKTHIAVGHIVLIEQEDAPPYQWPLGRILEIFPGTDDLTRVASIKTTSGILERPVKKLALLPIVDNEFESPGVC